MFRQVFVAWCGKSKSYPYHPMDDKLIRGKIREVFAKRQAIAEAVAYSAIRPGVKKSSVVTGL